MRTIEWKEPWCEAPIIDGLPWAQGQLEKEITDKHPLFGKGGKIVGRRFDCDDVLVILGDGTFANVHLVWGSGPQAFPEKWPSWFMYGSQESFIAAMYEDAKEYSDET